MRRSHVEMRSNREAVTQIDKGSKDADAGSNPIWLRTFRKTNKPVNAMHDALMELRGRMMEKTE